MSYLVLARKWRPRDFESLVGQEHVVRALTHALTTQRLHHAWLFTGTRGVGKTTLSRILAKSLNCESGITARPCGHCVACTQIDAGRFVDYVELDAASNRGVDEMTQLLEQAVYAPTSARFKVYMIDEVHMLSGHAFNAMLKTLEEPPPHVKFILATTDPQKIPATVLSRCLQFNLKQMAPESIANYLAFVLEQEQVSFERPALRLIGQAASGSMRDALSLTDQAIAFSAGDLSVDAVRSMLGTVDQTHLVQLLQALCQSDSGRVLELAQQLSERGLSLRAALGDLAILLSRIAILQRVGTCTLDDDALQVPVRELAEHMPADLVQLFYTVAVHSRQEMALAPDEYAGFIMICLRMLGFVEPAAGSEKKSLSFTAPDNAARLTTSTAVPSQTPGADERSHESADSRPARQPAQSIQPEHLAAPATPDERIAGQIAPAQASSDQAADGQTANGQTANDQDAGRDAAQGAGPEVVPEVGHDASDPVQDPAAQQVDSLVDAKTEDLGASQRLGLEAQQEDGRHGSQDADDSIPPWCDDEPAGQTSGSPVVAGQAPDTLSQPDVFAPEQSDARSSPVSHVHNAEASADPATAAAPHSLQSLVEQWPRFATQLPVAGMASQLALQSVCTSVRGETVTLRVATMALSQGPHVQRLRAALQDAFGVPVQLEVVMGDLGQGESAHQIAQQEAARRNEEAERQLQADPFVQTLIRDLGAQIVPGSIRP